MVLCLLQGLCLPPKAWQSKGGRQMCAAVDSMVVCPHSGLHRTQAAHRSARDRGRGGQLWSCSSNGPMSMGSPGQGLWPCRPSHGCLPPAGSSLQNPRAHQILPHLFSWLTVGGYHLWKLGWCCCCQEHIISTSMSTQTKPAGQVHHTGGHYC